MNYEDVLNSNGGENFLNNNTYSKEYFEYSEKWKKLPVYSNKKITKEFFDMLENKQVILLTSGTGSGKTVIIPKFLLRYMVSKSVDDKLIAVTNPKILTTMSNAEYASKTLDVELGNEVGYSFRGGKLMNEKTKLLYVTDGSLLSNALHDDKKLKKYYGIIIDEAHERNVQIDQLLGVIKKILPSRPDLKIIIMSATINAKVFRDYFNTDKIQYGEIEIYKEPNYKIDQIWPKDKLSANYLNESLKIVKKILDTTKNGDIIVFVPSQKDTFKGCELVKQIKKLFCTEVFSKMTDENKELAISKTKYKDIGTFERKIIFATNVAESSITFDGLVYVIDSGLEISVTFDSKHNMEVIDKVFTTQSQIKQRIGRTGRTAPGVSYHLYTNETYKSLIEYPNPSIIVSDLTIGFLSLIKYHKDTDTFKEWANTLITPPKQIQIKNSLHILKNTHCIQDGKITPFGNFVIKTKLNNPCLALALVYGFYYNCIDDIIIICSMIEISDGNFEMFLTSKLPSVYSLFRSKETINSDHLSLLRLYKLYLNANVQYLNENTFEKVKNFVEELTTISKKYTAEKYDTMGFKIKSSPTEDVISNILKVLELSHEYNKAAAGTTINFLHDSTASINFFDITEKNKSATSNSTYIFNKLVSRFGKKTFSCITLVR